MERRIHMLDSKLAEQLEANVCEQLNVNQTNLSGIESMAQMIQKIAIRATILTLQEYEKLNNRTSE